MKIFKPPFFHGKILKHKLFKSGLPFDVVPPTTVKKHATGKGNSDKNIMYEFFKAETKLDLKQLLQYDKQRIDNPIGDIVDSYYICKTWLTRL